MFLTMIPTIIEEGLASYNGHKLGKKVLKPDRTMANSPKNEKYN